MKSIPVFLVTINFVDGSKSDWTVTGKDDLAARVKAIKLDARLASDNSEKQPRVLYCEIKRIATAYE